MDVRFIKPSPERAQERIDQVYNVNFSELFELLYDTYGLRLWTPMLPVAEGGHREYTRDHDLSQSLGQDESELLSHIARYIVEYLEADKCHCMIGLEWRIHEAKLPSTRRFGRTIRCGEYMYTCINEKHASLVREFMLTATLQGNFFTLTNLAPIDFDAQHISELCASWAKTAKKVILSALDDDNYLVLTKP